MAHPRMTIPDGDVIIFAGDVTNHRTSDQNLVDFQRFLGTLPHRYKICISGNHETCLNPNNVEESKARYLPAVYLQDEAVMIDGVVKVWGTPWRPARGCCYRAEGFGYDANVIHEKRDLIPNDVDILITHGPPYGVRDGEHNAHIGCASLLDTVHRVRPKVHLFGHVHPERGGSALKFQNAEEIKVDDNEDIVRQVNARNETVFFNLSIINRSGRLNDCVVFDYYYVNKAVS
eukprot:TRINITY_DN9257_c0_g1_i12.p1 TRINITY_DN9257_c0_g1~~TRINITY_DN9257_c0_g1_i12.p1  ORF type:complete len:255 (+),score=50.25 TRINITY_DN9257_c0_g1_i12:70-765(+)